MTTLTLNVDGMTCGHCVKSLTKALTAQSGVLDAQVSLEHKNACISYDPAQVTPETLLAIVEDEGFHGSL